MTLALVVSSRSPDQQLALAVKQTTCKLHFLRSPFDKLLVSPSNVDEYDDDDDEIKKGNFQSRFCYSELAFFFFFSSLSRSVRVRSETNELNRKRERESAVRFMPISLEHSRFVHWKKTGGGGKDEEEEEEHRWQQSRDRKSVV